MKNYLFGNVQLARGCPFRCEFCDIIETFGRRPRLKTTGQALAELDTLRNRGFEMAFVVDDNLAADRNGIKPVLHEIAGWQSRHGYPIALFAQASLDVADDDELLQLMAGANVHGLFVGIESPSEASLRETGKLQNLGGDRTSLIERVHRIQGAGIDVTCGLIVGFDSDGPEIFALHRELARESRIAQAMIGLLTAIPKTRLHERLAAEGRLDLADTSPFGTNVVPARLSREELRDGFVRLFSELYSCDAYFERLEALFLEGGMVFAPPRSRYLHSHRWARARGSIRDAFRCLYLVWKICWRLPDVGLRREYRRRGIRWLRRRRDPFEFLCFLMKCAFHFHYAAMADAMNRNPERIFTTI